MTSTLSPRLLAGFAALLALMAALAVLALNLLADMSERATTIAEANIPELAATATAAHGLQEYRDLQLRHLLETSPAAKAGLETQLAETGLGLSGGLEEYRRVAPEEDERAEAARLLAAWRVYVRRSARALELSRRHRTAEGLAVLTGPALRAFDTVESGLDDLRAEEQAEAEATSEAGRRSYRAARTTLILAVTGAILATGLIGLWSLVIRPLRRAGAVERYRRSFQQALEMADTEEEAIAVAARGLAEASPKLPAELLLADSSEAHLYQAMVAGPEPGGPGCSVSAPRGCAAVRRGQRTVFRSSEAVGACPRLRDRPGGPCSAVCTPVTVLGRTIGVLHATGPANRPSSDVAQEVLETTAAQVGSRLGVLRAMSQSQMQASTDPLTGLLNRRSLEERARDLRRAQIPFVAAMADLDHFKDLNDAHGHETGDRALRLFARTLAETVRVQDIVARHGGEEFVVIFPRASASEAAEVLERVRQALQTAVIATELPAFTFSVGVADAAPDEPLHEVLRAADQALLGAKRSGRDRILVAPSIRE